ANPAEYNTILSGARVAEALGHHAVLSKHHKPPFDLRKRFLTKHRSLPESVPLLQYHSEARAGFTDTG
ncbi:unnamed protein product, partial [Mycena citricolor]